MGFITFWSNLTGPRVREIISQKPAGKSLRPFSFELEDDGALYEIQQPMKQAETNKEPLSTETNEWGWDTEVRKTRRRSRGFSLSRQKNDEIAKKRRSLFDGGGRADIDVPAIPSLPSVIDRRFERVDPVNVAYRRVEVSTTDQCGIYELPSARASTVGSQSIAEVKLEAEERKSRRKSIARVLNRRRSQPITSQAHTTKRSSWFSMSSTAIAAATPPLPPMPVVVHTSSLPLSAAVPAPIERHKTPQLSRSNTSNRKRSRSESSLRRHRPSSAWFRSSNPDEEDDMPPLPPLPAMIAYDETPPSESMPAHQNSSSTGSVMDPAIFMEAPQRTATRADDMKQPRPRNTPNRQSTYRPKSAEVGILKTTSPTLETTRWKPNATVMNGEDGVVWLSDEQQREWDKLHHLMEVMERRHDDALQMMIPEIKHDMEQCQGKYSNAQALAALEVGIAR